MRFKLLSILTFILFSIEVFAQTTITIPSANTAGTGASATIRRKPLGSNRSYERTAMRYSQSEIGMLGNITGIAFYCDTVINPGKTAVKVYIKEISDTAFTTATTVANEELNASLVYSDTLYPTVFIKNTWVNIPFSTPFLHANSSSIQIIIETNSGGTNGSDLTSLSKGFRYSARGILNTMQYWQSNTNSSTIPTGNGTLSSSRPNIQLSLTAAAACTAPPTAGTAISNASSVCTGGTVNLSLTGTSTGLGLSYQWMSSVNNSTWDTIPGAIQNTYSTLQTSDKYYACYVKCSGQSALSASVNVTMNPFYLCYCTTNLGGNCNQSTTAIDSVSFTGTTLANGATGCSTGAYAAYPASGKSTASLVQGETYILASKFSGNAKSSVWIDFNRNGIYEGSEWRQIALTSTANTTVFSNIYIPTNASTGLTGMRIRTRSTNSTNDSTSSCSNFGNSGETEDYLITIVAGTPCVAPPNAGVLTVTDTLTCIGSNVVFGLNGNSTGTGQTYEWYNSTNGTTWNLVAGVNDKFYTANITGTVYVKCKVTCSGFSVYTDSLKIKIKPFFNCYCVSGIGGNCTQQATAIDSIGIAGTSLNNGSSGCSVNYYTSYPDNGNTTANLTQGESYGLSAKFTGNVRASVWIDYNQNGLYENAEWQQICTSSTANTVVTMNLNIPLTALIGKTGMRIRSRSANGANDSTSSCATFGTGETEDYIVNISQSVPCSQPPNAGTTVSSTNSVCSGTVVNFNIIGNTTGTGQTYQWIKKVNNTTWVNIPGKNAISLKDTVLENTSYACVLNCSGFLDTSSISTISINPFYNCYCVSGIGGGCVNSATSIDSVAILGTTLDNYAVGCAPNFYTAYPENSNTTAKLLIDNSYAVETKFSGIVNASVWIDFDHSGTFDSTEWTLIIDTSIANVVNTSFIDIPANAILGKTGMRIRTRAIAGVNGKVNACSVFGSGETEDYVITLDTLVIVQGVANVKNDMYLKVYPNPASNSVSFTQTSLKEGTITIYNLQGKVELEENLNSTTKTISTENLSNGIYFYRYFDADHAVKSTGKIMIIK